MEKKKFKRDSTPVHFHAASEREGGGVREDDTTLVGAATHVVRSPIICIRQQVWFVSPPGKAHGDGTGTPRGGSQLGQPDRGSRGNGRGYSGVRTRVE